MEKIQWKNNEAPAISAENLNQMQTNIDTAKEDKFTIINNVNGTAIKYADGTMICYGSKLVTIDIELTRGSFYIGTVDPQINFPVEFVGNPTVTYGRYLNSTSPSVVWIGSIHHNNVKIDAITGMSSSVTTGQDINISYIAIGKWK